MVNASRSTIVITVSRCIALRRAGIATAITRSTWRDAKRRCASASTAAGRDRSPIPIITVRFPTTRMSPPSSCAWPLFQIWCGALANSGWAR